MAEPDDYEDYGTTDPVTICTGTQLKMFEIVRNQSQTIQNDPKHVWKDLKSYAGVQKSLNKIEKFSPEFSQM